MPVEVKRKSNENAFGLMRRFSDKVKKGRVLTLAKKNAYYQKKKNKRQQKEEALRRAANREKREFLIRTGKIKEDMLGSNFSKNKKR